MGAGMSELIHEVDGVRYRVLVECPEYLLGDVLSNEGRSYIDGIIRSCSALKDFVAQRYLQIYNESWIDEDHRELNEPEFKEKLSLEDISIYEKPGCALVYFGDGDMFGGHCIEVHVEGAEPKNAMLAG